MPKFSWVWVVLCLALVPSLGQANFTDQTNIPSWGSEAVTSLFEAKIINGNADGSLAPWRQINRAEFLKILTTATGTALINDSGKTFPDVPTKAWFSPYVHTAVSQGWAKGYPDGTFGPGTLINRAEIAKLMSQAWNLSTSSQTTDQSWYDVYVRSLETTQNLPYATTTAQFEPGKNPSRIEVFEQLHRAWKPIETVDDPVIIPAITEDETPMTIPATKTAAPAPRPAKAPTGSQEEPETISNPAHEPVIEANNNSDPLPPANGTPPAVIDSTILKIESLSDISTQIIYPGQGGITGFQARLTPLEGTPTINSLTFSHTGTAPLSNFSRMWLYDGSERISEEIVPSGGHNTLDFIPPLSLNTIKNISLKLDTPAGAVPGFHSQWNILGIDTNETTTNLSQTNFPIQGQLMEIHPE